MKNIKKIMVAIDFSRYSSHILEYAGIMAKGMKSDLIVVNVINNRDVEAMQMAAKAVKKFSIDGWVETQKKERTEQLQELIAETSFGHIPIQIVLRTGMPFKELMKVIEEEEPDLLVIGPKGRSDIPDLRVGSTAEKAFCRCPIPLLIVYERNEEGTLKGK
jgi:nucleotide-binding universal stress UspA family protein